MKIKLQYEFSAKIWKHFGPGGWHFVSLPPELANEIRQHLKHEEEGWGRLKATARIAASQWETAIWFDTNHKTYMLPLKAEIRKRENLKTEMEITVCIWI